MNDVKKTEKNDIDNNKNFTDKQNENFENMNVEEIKKDIEQIIEKFSKLTEKGVYDMSLKNKNFNDEQLKKTKEAMSNMQKKLCVLQQKFEKKMQVLSECTADSVQKKPLTAISIAAGVGFVVGLLLRR